MQRQAIVCGLIALATVLVYAQVASHEFVEFDDDMYITSNRNVRAGLTLENVIWAMGGSIEVFDADIFIWQPLTWLSYLVDSEVYGLQSAAPWLLTNVSWHVASAWVLLAALVSLTGRFWPSAFVAALFALHPIQTESVAWASGRRDVLAGFFLNLTLLGYARYVRSRSRASYWTLLVLALASLASKGTHIALPFLLLLLDYWPLKRLNFSRSGGDGRDSESVQRLTNEKLPLLCFSLAIILLNYAHVSGTNGPWVSDPPLWQRAIDGVMAYGATLGRLFWPDGLAIVYPTRAQMGLPPAGAIAVTAVCAGLAVLTALAAAAGQKRGYLVVGWLWFLGMLFPLVGLIPSGLRVMHDRYSYVPMVGLAIALAFGAADLSSRMRFGRLLGVTGAAAVLTACAVVSWNQVGVWRDSLALFDHALAVTERNAIVHFYRGNTLAVRGDLEAARDEFTAALEIYPPYPQALQSLGQLHLRRGRPDLAVPLIERAIEARPQWTHAVENLGRAQWATGDREHALATFEAAAEGAPQSADVRYTLSDALHKSGLLESAEAGYRETLRLDPTHLGALRGLARLRADERR